MKLTLLTHHLPNHAHIGALTKPNRDEYCARHGYTHVYHPTAYHNEAWYYGFQRLVLARDILFDPARAETAPDLLWVLNVSSVITNLAKPVTDVITAEPHAFWCTPDRNVAINLGSFIIRRGDWARRWLDRLISLEPTYRSDCWYENRAVLAEWEKPEWRDGICRLDQRTINAYDYAWYPHDWGTNAGQWQRGDLVLSMPGTSAERRVRLISEALANRVTQ